MIKFRSAERTTRSEGGSCAGASRSAPPCFQAALEAAIAERHSLERRRRPRTSANPSCGDAPFDTSIAWIRMRGGSASAAPQATTRALLLPVEVVPSEGEWLDEAHRPNRLNPRKATRPPRRPRTIDSRLT